MSDNENAARTAVVTGASSGIGKATAEAFARMGWNVIGTGRHPDRTENAKMQLRAAAKNGARVHMLRGDFCEMADVTRIAGEIAQLTDRIDVLVNNAGGVRDQRYVSSEGVEATMAANHYATFLLTRELMPILRQTAAQQEAGAVRVITVSSEAHRYCQAMRMDDLDWDEGYSAGGIYCQAKLANLLFGRELARRAQADGIVSLVMHPGVVDSNFWEHGDAGMKANGAGRDDMVGPESPARTIVWLATAKEHGTASGGYFYDMAEEEPAAQGLDAEAAQALWTATENRLASIGF